MNKKKHWYNLNNILYFYISLVVGVFAFFTIYAYRYDVLNVLVKEGIVDVSLPEEKVEYLKDYFQEYDYETLQEDADKVSAFLDETFPGFYSFSYMEGENVADSMYISFLRGRPPYRNRIQTDFLFNFIKIKEQEVVSCYIEYFPNLHSYFLGCMMVSGIGGLLLGGFCFYSFKKQYGLRVWKLINQKLNFSKHFKKIHTLSMQLLFINLLAAIIALSVFSYAYTNRFSFFEFTLDMFYHEENFDDYINYVREEVRDLNMNKASKKPVSKILTEKRPDYVHVGLYDENSTYYLASESSALMDTLFRTTMEQVNVVGNPGYHMVNDLEFKDTKATLLLYSYPLIPYVIPYQATIILVSFSFYLIILQCYIRKKVKGITTMQDDVLRLAQGEWQHEVQVSGHDEITVLGENLNHMRLCFMENMENEKEARNANKELISAISHDLRTPLTTLKGYLEIVQMHKGDIQKREEYIARCLNKVEELNDLSTKMFEYSLVFSTEDTVELKKLTVSEMRTYVEDHISYLKELGFLVDYEANLHDGYLQGNLMMMKRILNNLFSNVQKYANQKEKVQIELTSEKQHLKIMIANHKDRDKHQIESNGIGLKSVEKMVALQNGTCFISESETQFMIILTFPFMSD